MQLVEYLFSALHWGAFLLFAALAASGLSSLRAVISGDTGGFLMALVAVGLFPLNIGKARSIGCAILTVFALLVFIVSSNPYALLGFAGCFLGTLASFIVDYIMAAIDARRTRSGGELHPAWGDGPAACFCGGVSDRLVHFQETNDIGAAIAAEKQIKGLLRPKKIALIEQENPLWLDLSAES
jgi:hypothetical protein